MNMDNEIWTRHIRILNTDINDLFMNLYYNTQ